MKYVYCYFRFLLWASWLYPCAYVLIHGLLEEQSEGRGGDYVLLEALTLTTTCLLATWFPPLRAIEYMRTPYTHHKVVAQLLGNKENDVRQQNDMRYRCPTQNIQIHRPNWDSNPYYHLPIATWFPPLTSRRTHGTPRIHVTKLLPNC